MTVRQPRYSKEGFARRGDEIYESHLLSPWKFESGEVKLSDALRCANPSYEWGDRTVFQ